MKLITKIKIKLQKQKIKEQQIQIDAENKKRDCQEQLEHEKAYDEDLLRKVLDPTLEGVYVPEEKEKIEYCESENRF
ncbi:MAG: hypothetical protein IKY10_02155 [Clostridia bacterium]|nr:hypothetical protein [Clostridia bacterium]